uniref:Type I polyketide synthase n=1 Tax=Gambierdiscus polynesiensis TaxID=439318 RepID=A0A1S6K833_9DINO|nr:type I polyketide synthase [Gambierdiscus polynesiensis]
MAIKAVPKVDVNLQYEKMSQEVLGLTVSQALSVKGFCVISPEYEASHLDDALKDIAGIEQQGRFWQPPEEILEGLLGMAGSSRIAQIELPNAEGGARPDGESVRYFDGLMTEMSLAVAPFLLNLQIEVKTRTAGIIHEAGTPPAEGPELDEETCAKWISVFAHHKIMFLWALGPGDGTLELQPFDDESNGHAVSMKPGTLVILRADALSHRFSTAGQGYCLSCWLQKESRACKHRDISSLEISPCCKALEEWAENKIREYKESFPEEQANMHLPRLWEHVMNHTSFVGQHIAVRSCSIKQATTYEPGPWSCSFTTGPDFCTEIPLMRWNHEWHYDPNPEGWNWNKTNCRHGSFIDGQDLFDNTLFRISRAEAAGMDPGHRLTLETGYEALVRDGYKISSIMNSRGGVYVANPPPTEWGCAEKDCTSSGVCGGGGSIACGRFSFVHGMKGPCISIDVEAASSLVAVNFCSTNLSRTGKWEPIPYGLAQSWNLVLTPLFLVHGSAGGRLSPEGRTFAFEACATGFVRGECAISMCLKAMTSVVDEQIVMNDAKIIGALAASATNQSGRRTHITAPDGVAMQEVVYEAVKQAEISPLDIDAVDCASDAKIMDDALEAAATVKAYRPEGMPGIHDTCPISLFCSKTCWGNHVEANGLSTILKVLLGAHWGCNGPFVHLRLLNPHMDIQICERPSYISTESLEFRIASSYVGITNRSIAGTNCHCLTWGQVTDGCSRPLPEPAFRREKIIFWPEGGGTLEDDMVPRRGYSIIGSWNRWEPETMESEGSGVFSYVVTLGENRWERFQILLDSDKRRVLFPSYDRVQEATKSAPVAGPQEVFQSDSWMIDTRSYLAYSEELRGSEEDAALALGDAGGVLDRQDLGNPGDRFKIRFSVKGKWRLVDWENLDKDKGAAAAVPGGSYQISGSWNHGVLEEMKPDTAVPGLFSTEVTLVHRGMSTFQIFRNRDWGQAIYPDYPMADMSTPILGPDEQIDHSWAIQGRVGDVYRIEFQRAVEETKDNKTVSWTFQRNVELTKAQRDTARRPMFFVLGSWDDLSGLHRMHWTGEYFQFYVQLGARARESFQIQQDGNRFKCIYPGTPEANPFEKHELRGPDHLSAGLSWSIGSHDGDDAAPGKRYEIRLRISDEDYSPEKVDWMPVKGIEGLEDARGRGFLILGQ